jgi:hypothetical protein
MTGQMAIAYQLSKEWERQDEMDKIIPSRNRR